MARSFNTTHPLSKIEEIGLYDQMQIEYPEANNYRGALQKAPSGSLDFIVFITGAYSDANGRDFTEELEECTRVLKSGGLLFIQGSPEYLPKIGVQLDQKLKFKYWIAVESAVRQTGPGLPSVHSGLLMFIKGNKFKIQKTRFPHEQCSHCGRTLRDWGGKTHLMNPAGRVISDVWTELPKLDNYKYLSTPVLNTLLQMIYGSTSVESENKLCYDPDSGAKGMIGPSQGLKDFKNLPKAIGKCTATNDGQFESGNCLKTNNLTAALTNVIHQGDALEVLKNYPDNSIDLVFADPPYNLQKDYSVYNDERENERYLDWCNSWLDEYARILRPGGSLYLLNLPRWTMYHADFLNRRLTFQNWIVWDSLAEPRGRIMPAHYGLLYYTKGSSGVTFNYDSLTHLDSRSYCLRASCIRNRKSAGIDSKELLTDLWQDIHRIKHQRDRDYHPCQLPDSLMERIIRLSTNEGDIVLDALCGTGTTPVVAAKLGRRYIGIDLDQHYVEIARKKLANVERLGYVERQATQRPKRAHSKKALQLELRGLADKLGRLPTPEDVNDLSEYDISAYLDLFPTWGKALKAAKLQIPSESL